MWKKYKYHIILAVFVLVLWGIEASKPREIDWRTTYSRYDKIPFGNYVLYNLLDDIFPGEAISTSDDIRKTVEKYSPVNYLFINSSIYFTDLNREKLLQHVADGNNVFIAAETIDPELLDTLELGLDESLSRTFSDSFSLNLLQDSSTYTFSFGRILFFKHFDTLNKNVTRLGSSENGTIHFISVPFGRGRFFLHLTPRLFTNYNMLKDNNHEYVSKALSLLPENNVVWDEYYKDKGSFSTRSPLMMISQTKGMREALQLTLLALVLYILFRIKRKQRPIPELPPKKNTTLEFANTIGNLYFEVHNNKDIAQKRIEYFLSDLQQYYQIPTHMPDEDLAKKLNNLSGIHIEDIRSLLNRFNSIRGADTVSDEEILELEKDIENFNKNKK